MFSHIIIIFFSFTVSEENEATENTSATCVELQRELIRQEIETGETQNPLHVDEANTIVMREMCVYCHSSPCVLFTETLPACLRAFGQPKMNHMKRKGDYGSFHTILNLRGLWPDPIYIARKEALGWKMFERSCQFVLWKMLGNGGQILTECPTVVNVVHKTSITLLHQHFPPYP